MAPQGQQVNAIGAGMFGAGGAMQGGLGGGMGSSSNIFGKPSPFQTGIGGVMMGSNPSGLSGLFGQNPGGGLGGSTGTLNIFGQSTSSNPIGGNIFGQQQTTGLLGQGTQGGGFMGIFGNQGNTMNQGGIMGMHPQGQQGMGHQPQLNAFGQPMGHSQASQNIFGGNNMMGGGIPSQVKFLLPREVMASMVKETSILHKE